MAKIKATPNLPKSSVMQMPMSTGSEIKGKPGMSGSKKVTKSVMALASKGKSPMNGSNPYC